jgi:DUF1680 family protein
MPGHGKRPPALPVATTMDAGVLTMARASPAWTSSARQRGGPAIEARTDKPASTAAGFFSPSEVELLPGPFESARAEQTCQLLAADTDRLLHDFRVEAGRTPRPGADAVSHHGAPAADSTCAGDALGRYLSACSLAWAATREAPLRQRADRVVNELRAWQHAAGAAWSGASCGAGAPGHDGLGMLRALDHASWHGLQDLLAGLRDAHLHACLPRALPVLARLAEGIEEAAQACDYRPLQPRQSQANGGMSELLADLFTLTGQRRYLRLAERFSDRASLAALAQGRGLPAGPHAKSRIGELAGLARLHALLRPETGGLAAPLFWRDGPASGPLACEGLADECFAAGHAPRRPVGTAGQARHWDDLLRLTRMLFAASPLAGYADCQERILFNTLPAFPDTATGSADAIYAHRGDALYVNQFIASRLDWCDKRVQLSQQTNFPDEAATRLSVSCARRVRFAMRLRHPAWCRRLGVAINGRMVMVSEVPGRFVEIERSWGDGDVVDVRLPMHPYTRPLSAASGGDACMVGPVLVGPRTASETTGPQLELRSPSLASAG